MNSDSKIEKVLRQIFEFGIFIKGINGIWETISGFFILLSSKETMSKLLYLLSNKELLEDPNDIFFNLLFKVLENLSHNTQVFIAIYILIHGFLNLFLAIQLYRNKIWAYLTTIAVMIIFISYQIYRIVLFHSSVLTAITIFDILFIMLAWHEYSLKKRKVVV